MPPLVDSIPADEIDDEPKSRVGRILSQSPAAKRAREFRANKKASGGSTPRPVGRPRGAKRSTAPRSRAPKSLYPEIAATLTMANMLVTMSPVGSRPPSEALPQGRVGDELDEPEITLLARALDSQCQRSPRFRRQVERMLGAGAGGQLVTVLGLIATRRAARHGIIPPQLDDALGAMMAGGDLAALGEFTPPDAPTVDATPDPETGEIAPDPNRNGHVAEGFDAL